jgi:hypothetical protein
VRDVNYHCSIVGIDCLNDARRHSRLGETNTSCGNQSFLASLSEAAGPCGTREHSGIQAQLEDASHHGAAR